jgi:regulator of replication initiation timing
MKRSLFIVLAVLLSTLVGCSSSEMEELSKENEALRKENQQLRAALGLSADEKIEEGKIPTKKLDNEKNNYIHTYLEITDVQAKYYNTKTGKEAGATFKLRNKGDRTLNNVEVTIYFKDANGNRITEQKVYPINKLRDSEKDWELKPYYVWQLNQGEYWAASHVPTEWKEGNVDVEITNIEFAQ